MFFTLDNNIPLKCTSITDQKFYYCYTLFIQLKSSNFKRGYLQKSLVIVSQFYFKKLFSYLLHEFKSILQKISSLGDCETAFNNIEDRLTMKFSSLNINAKEIDLKTCVNKLEKIYNMFVKGIEENLIIVNKNDDTEILDMKLNGTKNNLQNEDKSKKEENCNLDCNSNKIEDSESVFRNEDFYESIAERQPNQINEDNKNQGITENFKPTNTSQHEKSNNNPVRKHSRKSKSNSDFSLDIFQIENESKFQTFLKLSMEISVFPQNNNFVEYLSFFYICKISNLWELVITETPIIIQADTPNICQEVTFLLSSLIFPLEYVGDIRPYFTIYDIDFKDYKEDQRLKNLNSSIVGVINPICTRMLKDWVVIHFDDLYFQQLKIDNLTKFIKKEFIDEEGIPYGIENCKRKLILSQNKSLLKTVYELIENSDDSSLDKINIYLRMYMIELNNDFMRTFEEYFFSNQLTRIKRLPLIKSNFSIFELFDENCFLKYLNTSEIYFNTKYVKDKKKTVELYSNFIQTKSFKNYLKNLM
jgi:hypothetical protein